MITIVDFAYIDWKLPTVYISKTFGLERAWGGFTAHTHHKVKKKTGLVRAIEYLHCIIKGEYGTVGTMEQMLGNILLESQTVSTRPAECTDRLCSSSYIKCTA
jgi:hypothetical protein